MLHRETGPRRRGAELLVRAPARDEAQHLDLAIGERTAARIRGARAIASIAPPARFRPIASATPAPLQRTGKRVQVHLWHFDARDKVARFRHVCDTHLQHLAWASEPRA